MSNVVQYQSTYKQAKKMENYELRIEARKRDLRFCIVRQSTLRLVYRLSVRQLDVSTAFLNDDLDEDIFMKQRPGL